MSRGKKGEIALIRRELVGETEVRLTRLVPDTGTDEGEKKRFLIWQNFRLRDGTGVNAMVMGEESPDFCEGKEAAAANTVELFDSELFNAGAKGVHVDRLSNVHSYYFGGGFERVVGKKLRAFIKEKYEYDEKTGVVKANTKLLNAMRKREVKDIQNQLYEEAERSAKRARVAI
mmetsp:Transcript_17590/g.40884  ORF Transcript_17590/g.40884 Transcript_17590/m.40884 type:complete len:174 (-) Transcript_17590:107-628(-)